ncbi:MAG: hypothetical protein J3Q66DRAFT_391431 [Benniella sp.]|nr:MAG: hypothetical protein J3Q66DRAFT_391431 [Benniella sp.]
MALSAAETNPLEIPEIRMMVGQYLNRPDLAQCLRVCKSCLSENSASTQTLQNLSSLVLVGVKIELEDSANFWDQCTRLELLSITFTRIAQLPDSSLTFGRFSRLVLVMNPMQRPIEQHLVWMVRCPNLNSLSWRDGIASRTSMHAFANHQASGACPNLCELDLSLLYPPDTQLCQIIKGMRQVKTLTIDECRFGPLSFAALRPHFSEKLDIDANSTTSQMVPEVLASCSHLEWFFMRRVMSQDIIQGRPWVCTHSMTFLQLNIIIPPGQDVDHHQRQVLERIALLTNLENFFLDHKFNIEGGTLLGLQLGKGLELLTTLKRIRQFALLNHTQQFTEHKVEWMIDNWTSLRFVQGLSQENRATLEAAGIGLL